MQEGFSDLPQSQRPRQLPGPHLSSPVWTGQNAQKQQTQPKEDSFYCQLVANIWMVHIRQATEGERGPGSAPHTPRYPPTTCQKCPAYPRQLRKKCPASDLVTQTWDILNRIDGKYCWVHFPNGLILPRTPVAPATRGVSQVRDERLCQVEALVRLHHLRPRPHRR